MPTPHSPIGIFDSGVGGLSVLQALRHELPHEQFVYLADSGNAPYGDARGDAFVQERSLAIAQYLLQQHDIKILVIACNTATAAAVELMRERMPQLPVIGVEPAIKPASFSSQTHHVGVMATRGTVSSQRVARLVAEHGQRAEFHLQACDGLARAIEQSTEQALPEDASATEIRALCTKYTSALGSFGHKTGQMDTLVLGCTHYVFVKDDLRALLGPDIQFLDTGAPVARQTRRMLEQRHLLGPETDGSRQLAQAEQIRLMTTGRLTAMQAAAQRWLDLPAACSQAVSVCSPSAVATPA
ncbi:glutamate racemase [Comamonas testosteroni]|uniref:Glutamate racemase n=2 Tax=Comamonas testosteroni TaxID=285 RepID=B7X420_COMTK|nr:MULTISPECIES: glutamate racemase [Comamonas]AIJ45841.1 glutamate racemase [Comamonas testosteroni TK102]EED68689.1 glutamate racemase [Comamonas testosteroni KF-1]MPS87140.1 glutamate racemase [Comamonas sp.]TYK73298.1 glutamate racemase [Comamonas sp. Z3]WQG66694.1 glutamate racemase [Comamonas testosteroni]